MENVLTVTTPSGKAIILTARQGLIRLSIGCEVPAAKISGNLSSTSTGFVFALPAARDGATHALPVAGVHIGISAAEADRVSVWIAAHEAAFEQRPEVQAILLRRKREALVDALRAELDVEAERRAKAWEREDPAGAVQWRDGKIKEARAALDEFDAQHPEVKAAVQAEQRATAERMVEHGF